MQPSNHPAVWQRPAAGILSTSLLFMAEGASYASINQCRLSTSKTSGGGGGMNGSFCHIVGTNGTLLHKITLQKCVCTDHHPQNWQTPGKMHRLEMGSKLFLCLVQAAQLVQRCECHIGVEGGPHVQRIFVDLEHWAAHKK